MPAVITVDDGSGMLAAPIKLVSEPKAAGDSVRPSEKPGIETRRRAGGQRVAAVADVGGFARVPER